MTLDEAEQRAIEWLDVANEYADYRADGLARFILRALPVLRWAEQWRDERCSRMPDCEPADGSHDAYCDIVVNERAGFEAIDAFRSGDK